MYFSFFYLFYFWLKKKHWVTLNDNILNKRWNDKINIIPFLFMICLRRTHFQNIGITPNHIFYESVQLYMRYYSKVQRILICCYYFALVCKKHKRDCLKGDNYFKSQSVIFFVLWLNFPKTHTFLYIQIIISYSNSLIFLNVMSPFTVTKQVFKLNSI